MRNIVCLCWKVRNCEMKRREAERGEMKENVLERSSTKGNRMPRKMLGCTTAVCTALLAASVSGCGEAAQDQTIVLNASLVEEGTGEAVSGGEVAAGGKASSSQEAVPSAAGEAIVFPEHYSETIGNVAFDMDILVNANLTTGSVVTAKAQMQKVNQEKAFSLFYSGIEKYDTYDYEEEDEYGKSAHSVTYVSPEETTFACGPQSSRFDYMERKLMPYVLNAFVPFQGEGYNADLYSTSAQLPFMTREAAFQTVQNALQAMDISIEADYTGYALNHETMQSQEHHEDMDGNIDRSQYKAQWSSADDCYYFYIDQTHRGLPLYHVYNQVFGDAAQINAPIQAVVSAEGIEWLSIEKVFTVSDEKGGVILADMDSVAQTTADKYNQVLGDAAYEMTKAQLYYYVDLTSGMGTYDVKPAWILTGKEKDGKSMQIIIDAQTAEEILP